MADININLDSDQALQQGLQEEPAESNESNVTIKLNIRKTLDDNIMIFDHEDIDIGIMPSAQKVVLFPKADMNEDVYSTQTRLLDFLAKKGVILPETIQGGNVYGTLEASYPPSEKTNVLNLILFMISKFIEDERPYFMHDKAYDKEMEKFFLEPEEEDSTELGEVPHATEKGSSPPWARFGLIYRYW